MADMAAPLPGQFDAQAPGVTAASGTASDSLEGDLHSLEQQLAELQVYTAQTLLSFASKCMLFSCITSRLYIIVCWLRILLISACKLHLTMSYGRPQVKVQRKRAEADSVAPYSRSFDRTLVGTLFSASGGLGLVRQMRVVA